MGGIGFLPILQAATSLIGAFSSSGTPSAPAVPQPAPAQVDNSEEINEKKRLERERILKQRGLGSTRATGPLGLQSEDPAQNEINLKKKTLLGD